VVLADVALGLAFGADSVTQSFSRGGKRYVLRYRISRRF
jgi:hypothetical protein